MLVGRADGNVMIARGLLCRVCCHGDLAFVGCSYKARWNLYWYKSVRGQEKVARLLPYSSSPLALFAMHPPTPPCCIIKPSQREPER